MIKVEWKAGKEKHFLGIEGREISSGTVFVGEIEGYDECLFIKTGFHIVGLDAGHEWPESVRIGRYQRVDIKITVDAERPE